MTLLAGSGCCSVSPADTNPTVTATPVPALLKKTFASAPVVRQPSDVDGRDFALIMRPPDQVSG